MGGGEVKFVLCGDFGASLPWLDVGLSGLVEVRGVAYLSAGIWGLALLGKLLK
jgi:hypothetical protein